MNERISVIIPVYNRNRFIGEALESVAAQNYAPFEVIVVDDGSTDDSAELARIGMRKHNLQGMVLSISNSGPDFARDYGIRHSSGTLLAFLDSDDRFLPSYLNEMVSALPQSSHTLWACADFFVTDAECHPLVRKSDQLQLLFSLAAQWSGYHLHVAPKELFSYLLQEQPIFPSGLVVRRSLYDLVGPFTKLINDRVLSLEWEFMLRCAKVAPIVYVHKPLVLIRKHEGNISGALVEQEEGEIEVLKVVLDTYCLSRTEWNIALNEIARRSWNVGYHYFIQNSNRLSRSRFIDSFRYRRHPSNLIYIAATYLPEKGKRMVRAVKNMFRATTSEKVRAINSLNQ